MKVNNCCCTCIIMFFCLFVCFYFYTYFFSKFLYFVLCYCFAVALPKFIAILTICYCYIQNVRLLSQFVSPHTGRIYGRNITGNHHEDNIAIFIFWIVIIQLLQNNVNNEFLMLSQLAFLYLCFTLSIIHCLCQEKFFVFPSKNLYVKT